MVSDAANISELTHVFGLNFHNSWLPPLVALSMRLLKFCGLKNVFLHITQKTETRVAKM